jgi:transposase InsO family protein
VSVTVTFRVLYVFVAMEIGSRRILHANVTEYPTSQWTTQQSRQAFADQHGHRFVLHDRDSMFSSSLDWALSDFGVRVLKTPVQAPKANAYCERLVGTIRRECLDYMMPMNERHLRRILNEFVAHYNRGRPHSLWALGFRSQSERGFRPAATGIDFPTVTESKRVLYWAGCIMNIAWKRRLRSNGRSYCGPHLL